MLLVFPQVLLEHGESPLELGLDVVCLPELFPEPGELDLVMAGGRDGVGRCGSGVSARGGSGVSGGGGSRVSGGGQGHGDQGGGDEGDLHDADVRP